MMKAAPATASGYALAERFAASGRGAVAIGP